MSIPFVARLAPGVAFVYSGMGAQWWGMGGELYASEPVFRAAVDRCAALHPALLRGFAEMARRWSIPPTRSPPASRSR